MFGGVTANRTHLRGVGRVYEYHRDTGESGFVKYFLPQIVKRPAMQLGTLRPSSPYPGTNPLEVFKGNAYSGAFSRFYKLLADLVIYIFSKPFFFAGKLFRPAFRGFCSLLLQAGSLSAPPLPDRVDFVPGKFLSSRSCRNIGDTQVNADKLGHFCRSRFVNVASHKQVEVTVDVAQVAFAPLGIEQFKLAFTGDERNLLPSLNRPDTYNPVLKLKDRIRLS